MRKGCNDYPGLAPRLESCLAALDLIPLAERTAPSVPPTLRDFRIVRVIGREAHPTMAEGLNGLFAEVHAAHLRLLTQEKGIRQADTGLCGRTLDPL